MGIIALKGLGKAFLKKGDDTIKSVKPTLGQKKTRKFKIGAGINRIGKQVDQLIDLKNKLKGKK